MTENFKLLPTEPTTNCKIAIVKERQDRESVPLSVLGWNRVLPNKMVVPVVNLEPGTYQCTALDSYCCIEAIIQCKIHDRLLKRTLISNPVSLSRQLKQKTLYVIQPSQCKISIDEFFIKARVVVENRKIKLFSDNSKCQVPVNQKIVEIQPYNFLVKFNFSAHVNQFFRFFSESLKWVPKFRSNFSLFIFNSKIDQDLFLFSIADCFRENTINTNQIKIVGTVTPRNDKDYKNDALKNDGSASSLTSNNKSRGKKQKVKITETINLKKSHTKMNSNKPVNNQRECLDIFENENQDFNTKITEQSSLFKVSDASMDLRNSFDQFQKDEDKLSNQSFRQKDNKESKGKPGSLQQQNSRLKTQNAKLKQEVQSMSSSIKQLGSIKKKYENAVQELKRLESQRIAIVKDKMKFQSAYYDQVQQRQKVKKQLQALKASLNANRNRI